MIVVHHLNDSRSQRILWLLEELGVPYEVKKYERDAKTRAAPPELKAIHPLGKSPVISDGDRVVAESGAIIEYILRAYGNGRLQADTAEGGFDDYVYWMHAAEGSMMPALIIRINVARVDPSSHILPRLDEDIANHLKLVESTLEGQDFLIGCGLTAADIQMSFVGELAAARFGVTDYPNIAAWVKRFQARPAYQAALKRGGAYSFAE
jgi:glutathione S-transferase